MDKDVRCIYCESPVALKGEGDHIVPAALGEFRGDVRFRRICRECNSKIGKSEQQFLRCGPASLYRRIVNPAQRRNWKRGQSGARGAAGAPAPRFTANLGGCSLQVRPDSEDGHTVTADDQLRLMDAAGKEAYVVLHPQMTAADLKSRIRRKMARPSEMRLWCDEPLFADYRNLIERAFPGVSLQELPSTEAGVHQCWGRASFQVTDHYFRAIAKMGFHYYLAHTQRGKIGSEAEFAELREFIMNGGRIEPFFRSSARTFVTPFVLPRNGLGRSSKHWCHLFCADETHEVAVAYVHLFLGPGSIPPPYYLTLGSLASDIVVQSLVRAHIYRYDETQARRGYSGEVESVAINSRRMRHLGAPDETMDERSANVRDAVRMREQMDQAFADCRRK